MPVCVHCAYPTPHLYTTYKTKSNIRLTVCARCSQFADPLIEHPPIILLLDLILLKPRVLLHLLYNRGTKPLDATKPQSLSSATNDGDRKAVLNSDLRWLAVISLLAEVGVRLVALSRDGRDGNDALGLGAVLGIALTVVMEMIAQHVVKSSLSVFFLWKRGWTQFGWRGDETLGKGEGQGKNEVRRKGNADGEDAVIGMREDEARQDLDIDGRRLDFLPIIIPLTNLYTSILPLLLNLLLSVWALPSPSRTVPIPFHLPPYLNDHVQNLLHDLLHIWANTDKIWAGTRLLGGMSSGFGLRVVLPTKPWQTTVLVLTGWAAAAWVSKGIEASGVLM